MNTDSSPAAPNAPTGHVSPKPGGGRATFPIDNGIYGVGRLAKHLNALLEKDSIAAWHLAGWTDWKHTAIRIDFGSPEDACRAADVSRGDEPGMDEALTGRPGAGARSVVRAEPPGSSVPKPPMAEGQAGSPDRIGIWEDEGGAQRVRRVW